MIECLHQCQLDQLLLFIVLFRGLVLVNVRNDEVKKIVQLLKVGKHIR